MKSFILEKTNVESLKGLSDFLESLNDREVWELLLSNIGGDSLLIDRLVFLIKRRPPEIIELVAGNYSAGVDLICSLYNSTDLKREIAIVCRRDLPICYHNPSIKGGENDRKFYHELMKELEENFEKRLKDNAKLRWKKDRFKRNLFKLFNLNYWFSCRASDLTPIIIYPEAPKEPADVRDK